MKKKIFLSVSEEVYNIYTNFKIYGQKSALFESLIKEVDKFMEQDEINKTLVLEGKFKIEKNIKKKVTNPKVNFDPNALNLYEFFLEKVDHILKIKKHNKTNWVKQFNLILNSDNRDIDECKKVIVFAANETEAHSNGEQFSFCVMSPISLREKYDKLLIKMNRNNSKQIYNHGYNEL